MSIAFKTLLILGLASAIGACESLQPIEPSGYLVNYKHLQPLGDSGKTLFFEDKQAPWKNYHSIMFSEVILRDAEGEYKSKISQKDLQRIRNYFHRSMANNVCNRLNFTNKPGEGVILLRAAIVDIKPVNVAVNVVSRGLFFVPVDFGKAAIEGELRDSMTGRHLVSIVDRKFSSIVDPTHSYTTWGAVEDALDDWTAQLGNILDNNLGH